MLDQGEVALSKPVLEKLFNAGQQSSRPCLFDSWVSPIIIVQVKDKQKSTALFDHLLVLAVQEDVPDLLESLDFTAGHPDEADRAHEQPGINPFFHLVLLHQKLLEDMQFS